MLAEMAKRHETAAVPAAVQAARDQARRGGGSVWRVASDTQGRLGPATEAALAQIVRVAKSLAQTRHTGRGARAIGECCLDARHATAHAPELRGGQS